MNECVEMDERSRRRNKKEERETGKKYGTYEKRTKLGKLEPLGEKGGEGSGAPL